MALFVGLVYLQLNNSLATGVNDRAASLWFAVRSVACPHVGCNAAADESEALCHELNG